MINPKPKPEKRPKKNTFGKPRKKKTNKQLLEAKADAIIGRIVKRRDGDFCVCPEPETGHSKVYQTGHLITRGARSVRWDLRNVHRQCSSCNLLHEFRAERYTKWYISEFGEKEYMCLVEDSAKNLIETNHVGYLEELCRNLLAIEVAMMLDDDWKVPYFTQEEIVRGTWVQHISAKIKEKINASQA